MPFATDTQTMSGRARALTRSAQSRTACDGVEKTQKRLPWIASSMSEVTEMESGRTAPGRYVGLCRSLAMISADSGRRAQRATSRPSLASIMASAVPQLPAPSMEIRLATGLYGKDELMLATAD